MSFLLLFYVDFLYFWCLFVCFWVAVMHLYKVKNILPKIKISFGHSVPDMWAMAAHGLFCRCPRLVLWVTNACSRCDQRLGWKHRHFCISEYDCIKWYICDTSMILFLVFSRSIIVCKLLYIKSIEHVFLLKWYFDTFSMKKYTCALRSTSVLS